MALVITVRHKNSRREYAKNVLRHSSLESASKHVRWLNTHKRKLPIVFEIQARKLD